MHHLNYSHSSSKSYVIKSKIYIPPNSAIVKRLKILRFCIIGIIVLIILSLFPLGIDKGNLSMLIIGLTVYLRLLRNPESKGGLRFIPVDVKLSEQGIEMEYKNVDKRDKLGSRDEKVYFDFNNIRSIEYYYNSGDIRFFGNPVITIDFEDKSKVKDIIIEADRSTEREHLLYI